MFGGAGGGASVSFHEVIGVNPEASSYNIDERRQKDDDDGEDAHQGAVQPRLDDPFGKSLQGGWEELGTWGGDRQDGGQEDVDHEWLGPAWEETQQELGFGTPNRNRNSPQNSSRPWR